MGAHQVWLAVASLETHNSSALLLWACCTHRRAQHTPKGGLRPRKGLILRCSEHQGVIFEESEIIGLETANTHAQARWFAATRRNLGRDGGGQTEVHPLNTLLCDHQGWPCVHDTQTPTLSTVRRLAGGSSSTPAVMSEDWSGPASASADARFLPEVSAVTAPANQKRAPLV